MAALVTRLQPGAIQQRHWHTAANEWHSVVRGRVRVTLFGTDKHLGTAELGPGDCAYIPANCGHAMRNMGDAPSEVLAVLDTPVYDEAGLSDWLRQAPPHLLSNNLGPLTNRSADQQSSSKVPFRCSTAYVTPDAIGRVGWL